MPKSTYEAWPAKSRQLAENWQRCRSEDIPALFSVYSTEYQRAERVVSFRLPDSAFAALLTEALSVKSRQFVLHLGVKPQAYSDQLPEETAFAPSIESYPPAKGTPRRDHLLEWDPKTPVINPKATESGINAIPGASAYLFVHSWLETPADALGSAFDGLVGQQDHRVEAYVFEKEESAAILADMEAGKAELLVHLGSGPVVSTHPFAFRPVIEIRNRKAGKLSRKTLRNATAVSDGDGGSFFDYSNPHPPYPPMDT